MWFSSWGVWLNENRRASRRSARDSLECRDKRWLCIFNDIVWLLISMRLLQYSREILAAGWRWRENAGLRDLHNTGNPPTAQFTQIHRASCSQSGSVPLSAVRAAHAWVPLTKLYGLSLFYKHNSLLIKSEYFNINLKGNNPCFPDPHCPDNQSRLRFSRWIIFCKKCKRGLKNDDKETWRGAPRFFTLQIVSQYLYWKLWC